MTVQPSHGPQAPQRLGRRVRGQGMTEYLVILGLIAIAAIAAFSFFGQTVRSQVAGMAQEVSGNTGANDVTNARAAAGRATENSTINMNMGTYTAGGNAAVGQGGQGGQGGNGGGRQ